MLNQAVNASVEKVRRMVRIVIIDDILPHPNADKLELAVVGGWQCCVQIGSVKKGERAIYCEIDSLLPIGQPIFASLAEKGDIRTVDGIPYARIRTIKLRKELSQGLVIPIPDDITDVAGTDLTHRYGVLKYEGAVPPVEEFKNETWYEKIVRWIRGGPIEVIQKPWPYFLVKSSQERVQNAHGAYQNAVLTEQEFECSIKLDGASCTAYLRVDEHDLIGSGICSRNNEISLDDIEWPFFKQLRNWIADMLSANRRVFRSYRFKIVRWKVGIIASENEYVQMYNKVLCDAVRKAYSEFGLELAIQGELVGPGIQSNAEGLDEQEFFVHGIYVIRNHNVPGPSYKMLPYDARCVAQTLGLKYVPLVSESTPLPPTIKECLTLADGPAAFKKGNKREGVVYSSLSRNFSFKVISNSYLLKKED